MSDTPETDAEAWIETDRANAVVFAKFARKLERERNEALEKIKQQKLEIVRLNGATNHAGGTPLKIALRERDEARESLKHITEYGTEEINAAVELRQKLATALVERDEAWKKLDEEMKWHHRTHTELVQTQCKILDMQMGRDEALEALRTINASDWKTSGELRSTARITLQHLTPQTQTKKNQ